MITKIAEKELRAADFTSCEKCRLLEICSKKKLYCIPAIIGILKGKNWEPPEKEE
jgi:hypothetical protein